MIESRPLGHIEHVVVLMFENRSFDNILGDLYPYGPNYNGVPPGWSNPDDQGRPVSVFHTPTGSAGQIMPFPDPNEDFDDMAEQIQGGTMKGFVTNYSKVIKRQKGDLSAARDIMQYYKIGPSGNIPITSLLASSYAVSDTYFGSGPVQTWPNRLFAHCGTPGSYTKNGKEYSYLNNVDYPNYHDLDPFKGQLDFKTVFELLDDAHTGASKNAWKVYYDGEVPISAFLKYVHDRWNWVEGGNVYAYHSSIYDDFESDIKNNSLPTYSFIEPRYQKYSALGSIPPNSNHPGGSTIDEGLPAISVHHGELLLLDVFKKLSSNKTLFDKTLLIVTYDEHGGLFDHVKPFEAVSPFKNPSNFANFPYTMYGPRVPAIFINPFIKQKVYRPLSGSCFDHTSIVSTLCEQFGLNGPLTPRDASAPVFKDLINASLEPNYGPVLPDLNVEIPQAYLDDKEPEVYTPPKKDGTVTDAVYRSYLANKEKRK